MSNEWRRFSPWALTILVTVLAVYVWGHSFGWNASAINAYQFFPVLGLVGFSIMWSHYMVGSVKDTYLKDISLHSYFRYTGYAVLLCILLHPGILIYQLFRDGYGLPPGSYESFVAPSMAWVTLLGSVSLLAFLAFELHRWYGKKTWWKYVLMAGDIAMLAVAYHGLRLGSQLQGGWYQGVWIFYCITLVVVIAREYILQIRHKVATDQTTDW